MGQAADQLRDQVDQTRDDAAQKIQQIEQRVAETTQQVKQQLDWRHQVEERPFLAVGAALLGGMVLGGLTGGGNDNGGNNGRSYASASSASTHQQSNDGGGLTGIIRTAAKNAGIEETIHQIADSALHSFGDRLRDIAAQNIPSLADQLGSSTARTQQPQSSSYYQSSAQPTPTPSPTAQSGIGMSV